MKIITEAQLEEQATMIQNKMDENVAEFDPHSLMVYSLELTALLGLCAQLARNARYLKDKNKLKADIYEGIVHLNKNIHYRISTLNTVLGYLGKERLAER